MPKWVKQDYVDSLDEFFGKVEAKIDWSKLTVKDLEALCGVLDDEQKVATLFGLDRAVEAVDAAGGDLGDLFSGGLMPGHIREGLDRVIQGGIDGAMDTMKREKPIRSQVGSGQLLGKLIKMVGRQ